jgi:hypothetical protein
LYRYRRRFLTSLCCYKPATSLATALAAALIVPAAPVMSLLLSDFSGGMDELVYSVYLSSELIVIGTQTVDGLGVLLLTHLVLPVNRHHLVAT